MEANQTKRGTTMVMTAALCLSLTIYFEARGEDIFGQLAVAQVVMNRVENPKYPDTVCGVVTQPKQFSYLNSCNVKCAVQNVRDKQSWKVSQSVANAMLQGHRVSLAATHYHTLQVQPYWANHPRMTHLKTIGNHTFYLEG
jgi:N-acetylmuramoyl-L-alanine amidase